VLKKPCRPKKAPGAGTRGFESVTLPTFNKYSRLSSYEIFEKPKAEEEKIEGRLGLHVRAALEEN
jgi:hypothetical protein